MRRILAGLLCLTALCCRSPAATIARADTIGVKSAELLPEDESYVLNAEFDLAFNPTLEEALQKGVPLYFVLEFELVRPRWYWLDEKVAQMSMQYRVSYNALTRQYRVTSGLLGQQFDSLDEVERLLVARRRRARSSRRDALSHGRALRSRGAASPRRQPVAEAVPDQRARLARLDAAVGVVSLELHAVSRILAPRALRCVLLGCAVPRRDLPVPARDGDARTPSSSPATTTCCSCSTARWSRC